VINAHIQERPEAYGVRQIIRRLVQGVYAHREEIDLLIQRYAPEWPVDQVAIVDRNILRIAVYEYLLQERDTPIPVIINEAVHLAQLFGAENAHGFVHGVLGTITSDATVALPAAKQELDAQ
jgi:N utilization substance protein B